MSELATRALSRRRRNARWLMLVGLSLFVAGFAGFGVAGDRADRLARTGDRTIGTVVGTALYSPGYGRALGQHAFSEHIDVQFLTMDGSVVTARCWIGESGRFYVGEDVPIVYDPRHPTDAQLARGSDLGPIGFPLFLGIVIGAVVLIQGFRTSRLAGQASLALIGGSQHLAMSVAVVPTRGRSRTVAQLRPAHADAVSLPVKIIAGGILIPGLVAGVELFGDLKPRQAIVAAQPGGAIVVGRLPRRMPHP